MALWSVFVNQLLSGEGSRQVSSSSRTPRSSSNRAGGFSSRPSRFTFSASRFTFFFSLRVTLRRLRPSHSLQAPGSLQALQVSDDGLQVVWAEVVRRHAAAGFHPLRVRDPAADVARGVLKRRGGDSRAAADVRQVWPDLRAGLRALDGVAHHARRGEKDHLAAPLQVVRGLRGRLTLLLLPRAELLRRLGDDEEGHVRVLVSTELRALAAVRALAVGPEHQRRVLAGDEVFFAREVRNPEAVNHVSRVELDLNRATDGDVNLVGGREGVARRRVCVANLPPPLMARHLDVDRVAR